VFPLTLAQSAFLLDRASQPHNGYRIGCWDLTARRNQDIALASPLGRHTKTRRLMFLNSDMILEDIATPNEKAAVKFDDRLQDFCRFSASY